MSGEIGANEEDTSKLLLPRYRVLDLAQGGVMMCGKVLADMGCDVIKVEMPGGDPSRSIGPFYHDNPQHSLFWFAYNTSKRGITLNIESSEGQELFRRLVKTAEFLVESFSPGYMEELGLGYPALSEINPRLIMASITPFGQSGPKSRFKATDLTFWASSGVLHITGTSDHPPVPLGFFYQLAAKAGLEAAIGCLIAQFHCRATGEGQHVDVSIQECGIGLLEAVIETYDVSRRIRGRAGGYWPTAIGTKRRTNFQCKDGFVTFLVVGGAAAKYAFATRRLVDWMIEEGMAPEWLMNYNWREDYDLAKLTQEELERLEEPFIKFFATKTKKELFSESLKRSIMLAPVNNAADVWAEPHFSARDLWCKIDHPELGEALTYCGPFALFSETPPIVRRPPLIGEHNEEVYVNELGLTNQQLAQLEKKEIV